MTPSRPRSVALACHPATPAPWLDAVRVALAWNGDAGLLLEFRLEGEGARLRVPGPAAGRADGLWRHTCCEAFLAPARGRAYREFNLSPSGRWQVYAFRGYRDSPETPALPEPRTDSSHASDGLRLRAHIPPQWLPGPAPLSLGLCAVVEDTGGALSYWALRHPPGKPDFHHPDGRALTLDPPP